MADSLLTLTGLSLFSGVGMLDEAVGLALAGRGIDFHTAAFCEWEASAASLLLARMEEQSVAPCPVFCGDLADFPADLFAGRIDIFTAGYPCQPYSVAGARRGLEDRRALGEDGRGPIHHMLRIIGTVQPRFVFLENVWEALKHFRPIGETLEGLGYTIAPPFRCGASDVGLAHRRKRMFVLAVREGGGFGELRESLRRHRQFDGSVAELADGPRHDERRDSESSMHGKGQPSGRHGGNVAHASRLSGGQRPSSLRRKAGDGSELSDESMAHPERESRGAEYVHDPRGRQDAEPDRGTMPRQTGEELADAGSERPERQRYTRPEAGAVGRGDRAIAYAPFLAAPGPDDPRWPCILADHPWLAPATEPGVCLLADGLAVPLDGARADSLRAGGNGVVALAGAVAFESLLQHFID